jgi:bacteriocin biosynthesis cyclodehydratase domain-containing protein
MRPTLLPNLRRLWRDTRTVQLGTDPASAVVIKFAEPGTARLLDLLDGSLTDTSLQERAEQRGIPPAQVRATLDALLETGLVLGMHALLPTGLPDATRRRLTGEAAAIALRLRRAATRHPSQPWSVPTRTAADVLRTRAGAHVLVTGGGPLVAPIATILAASGIGHLDPAVSGLTRSGDVLAGGLVPDDVGQPRAIAVAAAVTRANPGIDLSSVRSGKVTFVVQVGTRQPSGSATRMARLRNVPRLEVTIRQGIVVIGPLVRPFSTPCRECLELHREDRDPVWPALSAQLATAPDGAEEPCAQATALAGAAFAADEVLAFLEGAPVRTEAALVEIARPGEIRRRTWSRHPHCACRRRRY